MKIFIFSSGLRCGSTLLQRLLNSHKDIFIWGESQGYLCHLLNVSLPYSILVEKFRDQFLDYQKSGYNIWSANVSPSKSEVLDSLKFYINKLYGSYPISIDKNIWGLKETGGNYSYYKNLSYLFDDVKILHLTRNFLDQLLSFKMWETNTNWWNRGHTKNVLFQWKDVNSSFLNNKLDSSSYFFIRYEDMVKDTNLFVNKLSEYLGLKAIDFDFNVFKDIIFDRSYYVNQNRIKLKYSDMDDELIELFLEEDVLEIMNKYNYSVPKEFL